MSANECGESVIAVACLLMRMKLSPTNADDQLPSAGPNPITLLFRPQLFTSSNILSLFLLVPCMPYLQTARCEYAQPHLDNLETSI